MRDGGKGDLRRPLVVSEEEFTNSWDRIFGKKKTMEDFVDEAMKEEYAKITEEIKEEIKDAKAK